MLDYGSGPGTALLAIDNVWPDAMERVAAIEPSVGMESVAKQLLSPHILKRTAFNRYQTTTECVCGVVHARAVFSHAFAAATPAQS